MWFAEDKARVAESYNQLYEQAPLDSELVETFRYVEMPGGEEITLTQLEKRQAKPERYYRGGFRKNQSVKYIYNGKNYDPGLSEGNCWKHMATSEDGSPSGLHHDQDNLGGILWTLGKHESSAAAAGRSTSCDQGRIRSRCHTISTQADLLASNTVVIG